ncbi:MULTISPECIES: hypothetical protein [Bacillus]|uniref:Bacteriophage SP-beta YorD domain-containing protein n=1 Tax=Bacillus velezensis TaxID=492670 RepID=A0A411AA55_BACVE|nr:MULTISPECIES: hypothetical protein [Bacillus]ASB67116.1 hypothetical protein S101413_03699 [Bacillus velezensis]AXS62192.1 hypothetical protein CK238_16690 [Bacillus velezensis]AYV16406.1 hypothetical protein EEB07_02680 [Bacillus velezensis]AYV19451.1 hypothetical protein EEB07_19675 [Bacillus velezensis]MBW8603365.1 hypothetical protein [Bacillus amyloliquefaciens]
MIQVYEYDENFILTKPVPVEPDEEGNYTIPENCTTVQPPSFIKAMYHPAEKTWTEAATQEEKKALEKQIESGRAPSPVDELKAQNAAITTQLAEAQSLAESQVQMIANLYLMLAEGGKGV